MKLNFNKLIQKSSSTRNFQNSTNGSSFRKNKLLQRLQIQKDEWFFVSPYGIGDLYLILTLLPEFKRIHDARKITVGIIQEKHRDILKLFPFVVDRIEKIDEKELSLCEYSNFEPGHPVIIHPGHIFPISMVSLIGYKKIHLLDIYKILLNLPLDSNPVPPVYPEQRITENSKRKFNDYGLSEGSTVLMAPQAFSYSKPLLDIDFWKSLTQKLMDLDLNVAMMSSSLDFKSIKGVTFVDFPLIEAIPFSEQCGFFIGNRSGFCDLLSTSKAFKIILFSREIWHSGHLIDSTSLIRMGLTNDMISEIEFNEVHTEADIARITSLIEQFKNE